MRKITFAPYLPCSHCLAVFRSVYVLCLLFTSLMVHMTLDHSDIFIFSATFIFVRAMGTILLFGTVYFLSSRFRKARIMKLLSHWADIYVFVFVVFKIVRIKFIGTNAAVFYRSLLRYICLNAALVHSVINFSTVISGVCTNGFCLKTEFFNLMLNS